MSIEHIVPLGGKIVPGHKRTKCLLLLLKICYTNQGRIGFIQGKVRHQFFKLRGTVQSLGRLSLTVGTKHWKWLGLY